MDLSPERLAVYGGESDTLLAILAGRVDDRQLQLIACGLLTAMKARRLGAPMWARRVAGRLRERAWVGDAQMADMLLARADGVDRGRPLVGTDPEEIAEVANGGRGSSPGGLLCVDDGMAYPGEVLELLADEGEVDTESGDWRTIDPVLSHTAWTDMADFIEEVPDAALREVLSDAIEGRGAFSRFRRVLDRHPELSVEWWKFSDDRHRGRAVQWLDEQHLDLDFRY
jgi:hypothetical protein